MSNAVQKQESSIKDYVAGVTLQAAAVRAEIAAAARKQKIKR